MSPLAYFGIESSGLNLAIDLLIVFVVVLYFASVYWTYADARRRIPDPVLVGASVVAALFPFVGAIVYMVVRPPEYIEDVRERELETQAAEARLKQLEQTLCPHCNYRIESEFIRCPSCLRKLKERCANCSRPLDRAWTICPYCEADVPGIGSATASSGLRSRRRRGAGALEGELALSPERDGEVQAAPVAAALAPEELSEAAPSESTLARASSPPPTGEAEQVMTPAERRSAERRASGGGRASRPGGRSRPGA
ncbi:MAG TPA: zinc ribbon domain-containing protein [Solirubrobacteraceae bacterium]|nr:zinc ribbon domain-containing protein [Solirubrobacteraceae bacterium]